MQNKQKLNKMAIKIKQQVFKIGTETKLIIEQRGDR